MLAIFPLLILACTANALPEVKLGKTIISGREISKTVDFFGGIPFAEPPVGALRLRDTVLKTQLNTTRFNASDYGKACIQPVRAVVTIEEHIPYAHIAKMQDLTTLSEDCLTINIHRPAGLKPEAKLPVLFWTYGGGFIVGASRGFNGSGLVEHSLKRGTPIVYVNFNYRLGPLGFPQGQEGRRALNLGLKDQIAALEWVQANIHVFGGDKDKVTIYGESAGAILSGTLFLNPQLLPKLARGAILESGSANSLPTYPVSRGESAWQKFVGRVPSCASIATSGAVFSCLRNATTEQVSPAAIDNPLSLADLTWAPTIDPGHGSVYPDYASRLYAKGRFARLPFISGTNRDEGTIYSDSVNVSEEAAKSALVTAHSPPSVPRAELEAAVDQLLTLYPDVPALGSPYGSGDQLFGLPSFYKRQASYLGDLMFTATRRSWSQTAAKFGVKSYGYHFTQPQPLPELGVPHGSTVAYVYGQVPPTDGSGQALSDAIVDYWISFTVSLNPNDGKGVQRVTWPLYTSENQALLQLEGGNTTVIKDDFRKDQIEFINKNANVFLR